MNLVTYACSICRYVFDVDAGAFQTHMKTTHGRDVNVLWDGFKITADHQSPPPPDASGTALPRLSEDEIDWILTRHRERAPGYLFNGPQGACAACMQSYPCRVVRLLAELDATRADLARTRAEAAAADRHAVFTDEMAASTIAEAQDQTLRYVKRAEAAEARETALREALEGMECHCVAEEHGGLHYAWCSYDKARTVLAAPTPQQQPAERTAPAVDAGPARSVCCHCDGKGVERDGSTCTSCDGTCCSYHWRSPEPGCRFCKAAAPSTEDEQS